MKKKRLVVFLACFAAMFALAGCGSDAQSDDKENAETNKQEAEASEGEYTHRIILLSDTHYMSNETKAEYEAIHPDSKASDAVGPTFGYTQTEKMQAILDDVSKFMETEKVDAVLTLGDLSTDDYGYRNLAENYTLKYKQEVMDQFACDAYALPGNHEGYPNATWNEMFGYDRQYSFKIGDTAFIMLDTFNDIPVDSPSGSDYTGIDTEWLEQELEKYPTEQIFICTHYIDSTQADYTFNKILRENDRIVCAFMGHSHGNELLLPDSMSGRFLVNVSGYAYKGKETNGVWQFNEFDEAWAWGFGVLEWNDTEAHYYHVKYPRKYVGSNGTFDYAGAIEDEVTIKFEK